MIDAFKLLSLRNVGKLYKGVIHSSRRKHVMCVSDAVLTNSVLGFNLEYDLQRN